MPNEIWYTNKELFEEIMRLKDDMQATREMINRYNGLYKKIEEVAECAKATRKDVDNIISVERGRNSVGTAIRNWGGWIFGLASFLAMLASLL